VSLSHWFDFCKVSSWPKTSISSVTNFSSFISILALPPMVQMHDHFVLRCDKSRVQSTLRCAHLMLVLTIYCIVERCLFARAIHVKLRLPSWAYARSCAESSSSQALFLVPVPCSHHGNSMYIHRGTTPLIHWSIYHVDATWWIFYLGYIPSETNKQSLSGELNGPDANLFKPPPPKLFVVEHVSHERIVDL